MRVAVKLYYYFSSNILLIVHFYVARNIKQVRAVSNQLCGEAVAAQLGKVSSPHGVPTAPAR